MKKFLLKTPKHQGKILILCLLAGVWFFWVVNLQVLAHQIKEDGPDSQATKQVGLSMGKANQPKKATSKLTQASPQTKAFNLGDSSVPRVDAVDISSFQSGLSAADFKKIKAAGIKSVVVKLTEGSSYTNGAALAQIKNAAAAGLNIDVYHYFTANSVSGAQSEANHLVSVLSADKLKSKILIFNDVEAASTKTLQIASNLNAFWSVLANHGYANHGIYTGANYLYRDAAAKTVGFKNTWKAQYPYTPTAQTTWQTDYGAWQFSPTAQISGGNYKGYLDASIDYNNLFTRSVGDKPFN